jgi:thiamine biosynthesis lipoprotein
MGVTLDGIAKGYIVDQGLMTLRQWGFSNTLVEAGGDLAATGVRAPGIPWRIGIQAARERGAEIVRSFSVTDQAVATSGDYLQAYSADLGLHHILDPQKGISSPELASATVIADSGAVADALATALMVMGSQRGLALIESLPSCEAYLVGKDLRVWHSPGFVAS